MRKRHPVDDAEMDAWFNSLKAEVAQREAMRHVLRGRCREIPARIEPDKTILKTLIKAGETIPGVELVSTKRLAIDQVQP